MQAPLDHVRAAELEAMSTVLDLAPEILDPIAGDLLVEGVDPNVGREAMTAEQVLRSLVFKQMEGLSFEALAFHLLDSRSAQRFCRMGAVDWIPKKSTLHENIKRLRAETLVAVNRVLTGVAADTGVETGRKVRVDCTVTETNIHEPSDSSLLWDSVRVLTRLMKEGREACEGKLPAAFCDHTRLAKRRYLGVENAKSAKKRLPLYKDLLKVARRTVGYAERMAEAMMEMGGTLPLSALAVRIELERMGGLAHRVIDQTQRRVVDGEKVPAGDKVVSIFEDHSDIIVKSRRETQSGHKLCLTTGASSFVLDCVIEDGNPADSTLATRMIERQEEIFDRVPRQAAMDGGFASKANLADIKQMGVKDVAFHEKRGLEVAEMVKSSWVYKQLRRFRAGIEGNISFLERCFGLGRCLWRGLRSFKAYVWSSVISANLLILARHRTTTSQFRTPIHPAWRRCASSE